MIDLGVWAILAIMFTAVAVGTTNLTRVPTSAESATASSSSYLQQCMGWPTILGLPVRMQQRVCGCMELRRIGDEGYNEGDFIRCQSNVGRIMGDDPVQQQETRPAKIKVAP